MPKPISRQDVTARAEQVLNQRREAVSALADTQSAVDDLTATFARELEDLRAAQATRLKDTAAANTRAWTNAVSAGWSEEDLRRFGFTEPEVKTRTRRARGATPAAASTTPATTSGVSPATGPAAEANSGLTHGAGVNVDAVATAADPENSTVPTPSPVMLPGTPAMTS